MTALASVVIPAHDEERVIARTLAGLYQGIDGDDLEVVVVCNGCADSTAETVRSEFPGVRVLELVEPSKTAAVAAGNAVASAFPRVHLDADVRVDGTSLKTLIAALSADPDLLAVAPARSLDRAGCSRLVSWYYDVWEQLPRSRPDSSGAGSSSSPRRGSVACPLCLP